MMSTRSVSERPTRLAQALAMGLACLVLAACGAPKAAAPTASEPAVAEGPTSTGSVPPEPAAGEDPSDDAPVLTDPASPAAGDVPEPVSESTPPETLPEAEPPVRGSGPGPARPVTPGRAPDRIDLPANYEIVSNVLLPSESYLPGANGMPTGLVLLDRRERARNAALCAGLLGRRTATVRTHADALRDNPRGDYLVTHWPVASGVADEKNCTLLVDGYDYARATLVKDGYGLEGVRGPVILALDANGDIVYLDLSGAPAETVQDAADKWMKLALRQSAAAATAASGQGANGLFQKIAAGFASLVTGEDADRPVVIRFNDPVRGTAREFHVYRAGLFLVGATFLLRGA